MLVGVLTLNAQNIQVLNGISSDKDYVNFATFEIYKPLTHGPLYYFTDFKMSKDGYFESYSEISKYWYISKKGLSATVQYNAGLNKDYHIKPVYLAGLSKEFTPGNNFILSFDILYRYQTEIILDNEMKNGFQIIMNFSKTLNKFQISGYCDYWNINYFIFEPQIWYKIFNNIHIGVEGRLSNYTLLDNYEKYAMIGIKWDI